MQGLRFPLPLRRARSFASRMSFFQSNQVPSFEVSGICFKQIVKRLVKRPTPKIRPGLAACVVQLDIEASTMT